MGFSVFFRLGGTARFSWHRSLAFLSLEEATAALRNAVRAGHAAFVAPASTILPTTFEASEIFGEHGSTCLATGWVLR